MITSIITLRATATKAVDDSRGEIRKVLGRNSHSKHMFKSHAQKWMFTACYTVHVIKLMLILVYGQTGEKGLDKQCIVML